MDAARAMRWRSRRSSIVRSDNRAPAYLLHPGAHVRDANSATARTCADLRLLLLQVCDPFIIQTVLGHSQLSTTRRYTHVPVEVTKAAVTGLESLFEVRREKRKAEEEKQRAAAEQTPTTQAPTTQVPTQQVQ